MYMIFLAALVTTTKGFFFKRSFAQWLHFARHSHSTIEPNHHAVQHGVFYTFSHNPCKFFGLSRSKRKFHDPGQTCPYFVRHQSSHSRVEKTWCDCDDSDSVFCEISCQRQGQ